MFMRYSKRFFLVLMACAVLFAPLSSRAADANDPAAFISDLGRRAVDTLTSKNSLADRERDFRVLFEEGFDLQAIGRFVLGPYWRSATDQQRQEFLKLFEAYVVHSYAVRFSEYSGQQLKVLGSRPAGDNAVVVQSDIVQTNGAPPIKLDWQLSKTDKGDKITDVNIEGVSMAITQRQEFASVIQRNGGQLDALLNLLREKSQG